MSLALKQLGALEKAVAALPNPAAASPATTPADTPPAREGGGAARPPACSTSEIPPTEDNKASGVGSVKDGVEAKVLVALREATMCCGQYSEAAYKCFVKELLSSTSRGLTFKTIKGEVCGNPDRHDFLDRCMLHSKSMGLPAAELTQVRRRIHENLARTRRRGRGEGDGGGVVCRAGGGQGGGQGGGRGGAGNGW